MYFEQCFFLFTQRCFLSVSLASLAFSKTDDVITENGFFLPSTGAQLKPYDRPGTVLQQSACFFFLCVFALFFSLLSAFSAFPVYYADASLTMIIENATE